ncbi:carbohydrate ABC transporter permease [Clostridium oryzae]|uniref:L-arabinose transport system permease protein AraQ n=1 Tax=Clostridium oryzae TaxID=1450648 RepID=A0A1V4IU56_9CLOT|nr:carbohydrate ABC transporter permease [Clostridium oryzae]OPJ63449.1 L-arabinose transport system permease protein AraQ [Clostridium oryzae]
MKKQISSKLTILDGIRIFLLCVIAIMVLFPFYFAILYAFKTPVEIANNPITLPTKLNLQNFVEAIKLPNYISGFFNSVITAVFVVFLVVIVTSMASYKIVRKNNKFYNTFYYLFQFSILLPFQVIMFPLYSQLKVFHMINRLPTLMIVQTGILIGFYSFLYAGFIKTVPIELEEAATIDGCTKYGIFFKIVFPLLRPITMTIIVLVALASWNDFIVPMVFMQQANVRTMPLIQFYLFGQYSQYVNVAFAAVILSMIPVLIIYFAFQKYIVSGITAGAVKG